MKKLVKSILGITLVLGLAACGSQEQEDNTILVGASPSPHAEILEFVKDQVEAEGYTLEIKEFDDYVLPNTSLEEGELDANYFQHNPYLVNFNEERGTNLVSAGAIHFEPLGIYADGASEKNDNFSIDDVAENAQIAVPDDATNEARALLLLEAHGIITLSEDAGLNATAADIVDNPKNITLVELEAANIPAILQDVDYAVINGNYALSGNVSDKLICNEDPNSTAAQEYANIVAVKEGNENDAKIQALIKALTSEETKAFIEETFGDIVVAVF